MTITRFSHIGLCVSDLSRSLAFYRDALGFVEFDRLDVHGEAPETLLGLCDVDLAASIASLESAGARVLHGSRTWNAEIASGAVFALDPDGTRIELIATAGTFIA